jgi:hypothetical protein
VCAMTRPGTETVRLDELGANATAATTVQLVDGWVRAPPRNIHSAAVTGAPHGGDPAYSRRTTSSRTSIEIATCHSLPDEPRHAPRRARRCTETRGYEIEEPTLLVVETPAPSHRPCVQIRARYWRGIDEYCGRIRACIRDDDVGRDRPAYAYLLRHPGLRRTAVLPVKEMPIGRARRARAGLAGGRWALGGKLGGVAPPRRSCTPWRGGGTAETPLVCTSRSRP